MTASFTIKSSQAVLYAAKASRSRCSKTRSAAIRTSDICKELISTAMVMRHNWNKGASRQGSTRFSSHPTVRAHLLPQQLPKHKVNCSKFLNFLARFTTIILKNAVNKPAFKIIKFLPRFFRFQASLHCKKMRNYVALAGLPALKLTLITSRHRC